MKIEFTPINVESQKIKESRPCYIELLQDRFLHHFDADIEEMVDPDDKMMGWKDSRLFFHNAAKRSEVVMVEKSLSQKGNWVVGVAIIGLAQDFVIYFEKDNEKGADDMYQKIEAWIFEK